MRKIFISLSLSLSLSLVAFIARADAIIDAGGLARTGNLSDAYTTVIGAFEDGTTGPLLGDQGPLVRGATFVAILIEAAPTKDINKFISDLDTVLAGIDAIHPDTPFFKNAIHLTKYRACVLSEHSVCADEAHTAICTGLDEWAVPSAVPTVKKQAFIEDLISLGKKCGERLKS